MEYPFHIELDISQDDFIRAEILEMGADTQIDRREDLISFIAQSFLALAVGVILFITYRKGNAEGWTLFLPFLFEAFFRLNFRFNYFSNYKREFRYGVNHLLENRADHTFFKPEKGFAEFYPDRCEYLTDRQRRYFGYENIRHIKKTKHDYIFVMKKSKDIYMKGFVYMVIPRRNIDPGKEECFDKICREICEKYDLKPWQTLDVLD